MNNSQGNHKRLVGAFAAGLISMALTNAAVAADRPLLRVGTGMTTESNIVAEVVVQAAALSNEVNAGRQLQPGELEEIAAALKSGALDIYPATSHAIAQELLKRTPTPGLRELNQLLTPLGLAATLSLGGRRPYALAMPERVANQLHIETIGTLKGQSQLRVGFSVDFLRDPNGFAALELAGVIAPTQLYKEFDPLLLDQALAANNVDLFDIAPTDINIEKYKLRLLTDDINIFGSYDLVLLHRADIATRFPKTWARLKLLENVMTESTVAKLKNRVDSGASNVPNAVAGFLALSNAVPAAINTPAQADTQSQIRPAIAVAVDHQAADVPLPASFATGNLQRLTQQHLLMVLLTLLVSIVIGIPLGILASYQPGFAKLVRGMNGFFKIAPFVAILAIAAAALNQIGPRPVTLVMVLYGLLPIITAAYLGLSGVPDSLRESAFVQGLRGFTRLRLIDLPLAMDKIMDGIRRSAVIAVGTATVAGFFGAGGYGARIAAGLATQDYAAILSGAVPAVLLALLIHFAVSTLGRIVTPLGVEEAQAT